MSLGDDRNPVVIDSVTGVPGTGEFGIPLAEYRQPDIEVDTSQRFVEHDVIGGPTVRQKVGRNPTQIHISGAVTAAEAYYIDLLRKADTCVLNSNRINQECHIKSTSTEPVTEGGGQNVEGEWTHTFTIDLVSLED